MLAAARSTLRSRRADPNADQGLGSDAGYESESKHVVGWGLKTRGVISRSVSFQFVPDSKPLSHNLANIGCGIHEIGSDSCTLGTYVFCPLGEMEAVT